MTESGFPISAQDVGEGLQMYIGILKHFFQSVGKGLKTAAENTKSFCRNAINNVKNTIMPPKPVASQGRPQKPITPRQRAHTIQKSFNTQYGQSAELLAGFDGAPSHTPSLVGAGQSQGRGR